MRRQNLLSRGLLQAVLLLAPATQAHPYPKDELHDHDGLGFLMPRDCAAYCGSNNQFCCMDGEACFTSANIAGCRNTAAGGGYGLYTTTWTQTETFTSTFSSYFPAASTQAPENCVPVEGSGQKACGSICCASWQYCAYDGQCGGAGGGGGGDGGGGGGGYQGTTTFMTTFTSGGAVITTQYSAPYRVTSGSTITGTAASATSTGNGTVVAGGSAPALSAGAIVGIVFGVLVGLGLLFLICACCLVRGLWNSIMALLGLGKKKKRDHSRDTTVIEEERYHHHGHGRAGSVHSRRERHSGWFGIGGGRPSAVADSRRKEKKKSSGAGWLGLAGAAGTLLLLLGLRRDKNKKAAKTRSDVSSSYFTDSYGSSPSSRSSRTHRTRDTHRTRRTETTRVSRAASRR